MELIFRGVLQYTALQQLRRYGILYAAGLNTRLATGFNAGAGHSWVVLGDKPLFESQARLLDYRPILSLRAGDTRRAEITPLKDNSATCAKTLTVSLRTIFKNII